MNDVMRTLREHLPTMSAMPTTEDLLDTVGLQYRRSALSVVDLMTAFAVGAVAGAVLTALFAPKSGQAMRRDLNERVRAFGDRMGWSERRGEDGEATAH